LTDVFSNDALVVLAGFVFVGLLLLSFVIEVNR
jgi:hypothetical protein